MTYILCIEASTNTGSVALIHDGQVVAEQTVNKDQAGDHIMPAIDACLASAGASVNQISKIICGAGPGSFTSLRISAAIGKGLAVGIGCELYAVPSDKIPHARDVVSILDEIINSGPVDIVSWEPDYGQKPLAQVKWEEEHGRPLQT